MCTARQEGANIATNDTAAPASPAAFRPISTTISDPGPRRGAGDREHVKKFLSGQPMVLIHRGALHVGDDARAAAEGQHRQHGEQAGELQQDQAHVGRVSQAASRLTGIITSSTCTSEKPSTPIDSATVGGDERSEIGPAMLRRARRTPVPRFSPIATAPIPPSAQLIQAPRACCPGCADTTGRASAR